MTPFTYVEQSANLTARGYSSAPLLHHLLGFAPREMCRRAQYILRKNLVAAYDSPYTAAQLFGPVSWEDLSAFCGGDIKALPGYLVHQLIQADRRGFDPRKLCLMQKEYTSARVQLDRALCLMAEPWWIEQELDRFGCTWSAAEAFLLGDDSALPLALVYVFAHDFGHLSPGMAA